MYVCQSGCVTLRDQCYLSSSSSCMDLREGGVLDAEDTFFSIAPDGVNHTMLLGRGITTLTGAKTRLVRCKMQVGGILSIRLTGK